MMCHTRKWHFMNKHIPWQLIISRLKDEQDERGEKLFEEWLQGEGNAHLYQELEGLWREIREEASSYTPDTAFYWQQLESRMSLEIPYGGSRGFHIIDHFVDLLFLVYWRRPGRLFQ